MKKVLKKRIFIAFLFLVFGSLLAYSCFELYNYFNESTDTTEQILETIDKTRVVEYKDNNNIELLNKTADKEDYYWDFIKKNLFDVDFAELKNINSETKGWIQVAGTNVNYPFVQTDNNDYYLTHSFDKSKNAAGWVFADYRNNFSDITSKNTILYAHGRWDETMFGSLRTILTNGWLKNKSHFVIRMSTETENTMWQIFSVYTIPTTSDYLNTKFPTDKLFMKFADKLLKRSKHDFKTDINKDDRLLTLSTCFNQDEKLVVHAKLIKRELKSKVKSSN